MKDLNDATSSVDAAGSIAEVANLLLIAASQASGSLASREPLAKADMKSAAALVGDAKGLSGRLCSKLHSIVKRTIFETVDIVRKLRRTSYMA